jgi:hypothetical protein
VDVHEAIIELGFPVVAALGAAGGVWFLLRWLTKSISSQIEASRHETHTQLKELHAITVKLIDRTRQLEDEIIRVYVTVAQLHELRVPLERIGRKSEKGE